MIRFSKDVLNVKISGHSGTVNASIIKQNDDLNCVEFCITYLTCTGLAHKMQGKVYHYKSE